MHIFLPLYILHAAARWQLYALYEYKFQRLPFVRPPILRMLTFTIATSLLPTYTPSYTAKNRLLLVRGDYDFDVVLGGMVIDEIIRIEGGMNFEYADLIGKIDFIN